MTNSQQLEYTNQHVQTVVKLIYDKQVEISPKDTTNIGMPRETIAILPNSHNS